jgi:SPP1 gp7 family putative phage head morphogenesis protein
MAGNSAYWRRRSELLEAATHEQAGKLTAEIERQFNLAQKAVDEQVEQWYGRFAANNGITLAEARQWLTGKDLAEWKWDVNEYIRHGKDAALNPAYIKQLENASARFHISKLDALKLKIQNTAESLYGQTGQRLTGAFEQIYKDNYYHMVYELQKGANIGWDIAAISQKQVESVLSKPWTLDKRTFSDRLWTRKQELIDTLHTQLTQNVILGKPPGDAIKTIAEKFNTSKSNAARLVNTESGYFAVKAQHDAFEALDVEEYEIVETLDSLTCPVCGEWDGKHLPMSQFEAGVTAPLYHANCRGCTCPYFADEADYGTERIARAADGKQYYVPSDMKYPEWKDKFVDGGDKSGLKSAGKSGKVNTLVKPEAGALMNVDMNPVGSVPTATKTETVPGGIIGVTTSTGSTVKEVADHVVERLKSREVDVAGVVDALGKPLHITPTRVDTNTGKPSRQFIGNEVTAVYNPDAERVVSVWPTGKRLRKKYGGKGNEDKTQ